MRKNTYAESKLDDFLKLPRLCQVMFFHYLDIKGGKCESVFLDEHNFDEYIRYCDSPIEQIFKYAFDIVCAENNLYFVLDYQDEIVCDGKRYVADFTFDTELYFAELYKCDTPLKLVIECDGHDYHEKTKEQVRRGNERDMALKMNGYDVLHFSGSQIYKTPFKCALDTLKYILNKIGKVEQI